MCSRRGLGLFAGFFSLIAYGLGTAACIVVLTDKAELDGEKKIADADVKPHLDRTVIIVLLVICSIMTLASALLVTGIIKRRHRYMSPWLLLTTLIIITGWILAIIGLFSGDYRMPRFIFALAGTGIQNLVLYPVYKLHSDYRGEYARINGNT